MMNNIVLREIRFTREGEGAGLLGAGWADPEDTFTWTVGEAAELRLPPIEASAAYLEFVAYPFLPEGWAAQRVVVHVNGQRVGCPALRWLPTPFAVPVPAEVPLRVRLEFPDAVPDGARLRTIGLSRLRIIGVGPVAAPGRVATGRVTQAYETPAEQGLASAAAALGVAPAEIAGGFESLGGNCEFGLWQRLCGIEPLGLLRMAGIFPHQLLDGIDSGFSGIGNDLQLKPDGDHWHATEGRFKFVYHTPVPLDEPRDQAIPKECNRLRFMRRHFLEGVAEGRKIYVRHENGPMSAAEALPLYFALCRHGPAALLFVTPAADQPPGTVEQLMPGLLRGHIARLGDEGARWWIAAGSWLDICANALSLRRDVSTEVMAQLPARVA